MAPDNKDEIIAKLKAEFEPQGYLVYPMSAIANEGIREILYKVREMLDNIDDTPVIFEQEYFPEDMADVNEPYTIEYDEKEDEYVVEGPRIEKMLGYTNLESERGFVFFQKFLKENGILEELEAMGIEDGDTVRMYDLAFDYYK